MGNDMQDSLEFATPRIHNPIYEFSSGCFDKDSGTFVYDPRFDKKIITIKNGKM